MKKNGHLSQTFLAFGVLPLIDNILYKKGLYYKTAYYLERSFHNKEIGKYIYNIHDMIYYVFHKPTILSLCLFLIITLMGGLFPDIDFKFKYLMSDENKNKAYLYHRQITHSLLLWLGILGFSIYERNIYVFFFVFGVMVHLIGDMLTGSIPIFLYGKYYNHFSRIGIDRITFILGSNKNKLNKIIAQLGEIAAPICIIAAIIFITKLQNIYHYKSLFLLHLLGWYLLIYFIISKTVNFAKV